MPKSWWTRGYLLGFALYLFYRLATATFWSTDLWPYNLVAVVVKAAIWPVALPCNLAGIYWPAEYLLQYIWVFWMLAMGVVVFVEYNKATGSKP